MRPTGQQPTRPLPGRATAGLPASISTRPCLPSWPGTKLMLTLPAPMVLRPGCSGVTFSGVPLPLLMTPLGTLGVGSLRRTRTTSPP